MVLIQSPEMAEAVAVRQALTVAMDKEFTSIVLASDYLSLVQKIQANGVDTVVGNVKRLAGGFSSCSFKHVNRLCNGATHILARSFEPSF
jgi:hypothetical protein